MRRDLDARDEIALLDDLTVVDGEHLERVEPVDPLELGDPDRDDTGCSGDQVEATLVGPAHVEPLARDDLGEAQRCLVLMQFIPGRDQHRHGGARLLSGELEQVLRREPSTFRPALAADREVAGQDRAGEPGGRASARCDPLDAQRPTLG